jgi:hypothetical protein
MKDLSNLSSLVETLLVWLNPGVKFDAVVPRDILFSTLHAFLMAV